MSEIYKKESVKEEVQKNIVLDNSSIVISFYDMVVTGRVLMQRSYRNISAKVLL